MYALSAADAIGHAIQRTRVFLFRPFRWGTFLKLCLVALITEGLGNFRSSGHPGSTPSGGPTVSTPFDFTPIRIATIVAMSLLVILLGCFLYYLITRLRFAYFHCLIHNTKEIRPGWQLYRPQAVRFFWLSLVVGFCFVLLLMLMALPFAAGLWRLFRQAQAAGHPDVGSILSFVLPLIPIIVMVVLAGIAIDLVLRDLILPHFALDNATAGEAWAAVWQRVSAEKGQFLAYALLRLVLPILAMIAAALILIIPTLILAGAVAGVEFGIRSAFAGATGAAVVARIFLQAFFGVVSFGFALLAGICIAGPLSTGIREYALLFYGGRYQRLGDILSLTVPTLPTSFRKTAEG
jgi:hypothetical protein